MGYDEKLESSKKEILYVVEASLSEPHIGQMASPAIYDLSIVSHSVSAPAF